MAGAPNGAELAASPTAIAGTDGRAALTISNVVKDMAEIAPGVIGITPSLNHASQAYLTMLSGGGPAISRYTAGIGVPGTNAGALTSTGRQSFATGSAFRLSLPPPGPVATAVNFAQFAQVTPAGAGAAPVRTRRSRRWSA